MSAAVIHLTSVLEVVESCASCGTPFAMPRALVENRRADHQTFYCPNGHGNVFNGKSEAEKLREQLDAEKRKAADSLAWRDRQIATLEKSRAALKGEVTKIKSRVGCGMCPCCNRTFQNVMRHMQTKHPDYRHDKPETTP